LFAPLGLRATGFSGSARFPAENWRPPNVSRARAHARGEVHDLNALCYGGVAGQRRLFANAADLHELASALCAAWPR